MAASWMWPRGGRRGILPGMSPAVPVPSGLPGARPAYWFPLPLSGLGLLPAAGLRVPRR